MTTFRALHDGPDAFVIPNPWDRGSAVMMHQMGFQALATTSAGMAFALGRKEGTVPFAEVLTHCREIVKATPLPVSADLEFGLGHSPEDAAESIRQVAQTGVAGCSLEDHTGDPDAPIYDFDLAVERIAAAADAAEALPTDMVLTARCENFLWRRPDLEDTLKRLEAYAAAGADVLYAPGLRSLDHIRQVCAALDKPVNVIMGSPGVDLTVADLSEAGVRRISVGSAIARRAYGVAIDALQEIATTGRFAEATIAKGFDDIERWLQDA